MANHKSSIKRIRSNDKKRLRNRYYHKTTRNAIKKLRLTTDKAEASEMFPKVVSMIDKLAKKNVIHKKAEDQPEVCTAQQAALFQQA